CADYNLYSFDHNMRLRLKVRVTTEDPHIPSVTGVWPGANFPEREAYDFFGIRFDGHPNLVRIHMPEDWKGYPQRKDYPLGGGDGGYIGAPHPPAGHQGVQGRVGQHMSEVETPEVERPTSELVDEVVVRPGEAHDLPPASAAERVSVNERRVQQVVAMGGGDWAEVTARAAAEGQDDVMIINMGPQHPSTHGVLRLVVELKGEEVVNLQPVVGYLHTGIEKSIEYRTWVQGVTFVTRMDYLAPIFNETAYCLAVERLGGIEAPPRAPARRVLMRELNRISSHLVWLATTGLELGALSIMLYGFREREEILDILE